MFQIKDLRLGRELLQEKYESKLPATARPKSSEASPWALVVMGYGIAGVSLLMFAGSARGALLFLTVGLCLGSVGVSRLKAELREAAGFAVIPAIAAATLIELLFWR